MLPPELLEILVCPACRGPLSPSDDQAWLRCGACRRAYPVRDGLPILLVEQARQE